MGETKRKKFHDRDKYYRLAKEQGFRSRAAFKLSQIHRSYPILSKGAKVVLDLCAAPGGWTQVCAKQLPLKGTLIVAVDILPIRPIASNVVTLVGDITTQKCKAEIKQQLISTTTNGAGGVDVVLHDGAPNVGASYDKDAYEQNELALHALKCATQHLNKGGHFVTKLYRSRDYASYLWIVKQLFLKVQAVKPNASRAQSAEIFLVCQNYRKPLKLDPRMLEPKHVFAQVEGDSTGGGGSSNQVSKKFNIFHKSWDAKRRNRGGYDMTQLDFSMRNITPVVNFVFGQEGDDDDDKKSTTTTTHVVETISPVEILSKSTGLAFTCGMCNNKKDDEDDDNTSSYCRCHFLLHHKLTTPEVKACLTDLKVLNKSDFKALLTWRSKMQEAWENEQESTTRKRQQRDAHQQEDQDETTSIINNQDEEEVIQKEIEQMRQRRYREEKKLKKKERAAASKRRQRSALGMDLNAIDTSGEHDDQVFSLKSIKTAGQLEQAREVDLDKVTHEQVFGTEPEIGTRTADPTYHDDDDASIHSQGERDDIDETTGYSYRLDRELDEAYDRYLNNKKGALPRTTKMAKRNKRLAKEKAQQEAREDDEFLLASGGGINTMDQDTKAYAKLLQGGRDGDEDDDSSDQEGSSSEDDDEDGFYDEPLTSEEANAKKKKKQQSREQEQQQQEPANPLIHKLEEATSVKTARWFSNPLFEKIGNAAELAALPNAKRPRATVHDQDSSDSDDESLDDEKGKVEVEKKSRHTSRRGNSHDDDGSGEEGDNERTRLTADDVLASMPKTDKQKRHEKRIKAIQRDERRQRRRAKRAGSDALGLEVVAAPSDDEEDEEDNKMKGLSENKKRKELEARALIKAGMGSSAATTGGVDSSSKSFEVVEADDHRPLPVKDHRKYDSENEDYDSDDYAQTLALGTMMLRRSKAKALVDASYNRFAWNDPSDLPDWFLDDEQRHYRPQLPIPPALLQKMKEKQMALSTRPIAKVAEARARKSKRAKAKLVAAKKKAEAVANSSEMSETMKLKAISKAMRSQDLKRPGKTYVVAKKGRSNRGGKGIKLVDKREKSDKRGMDRAERKRKHGKKNSLTGSKRRRHHS